MVISTSDNLRALFENLKSLGFFGRLFGWNRILEINAAANNEFKTLNNELNSVNEQNSQIQNKLNSVYQDLEHQKSLLSDLRSDFGILKNSNENISKKLVDREVEIGAFRESETKNSRRIAELEREIDRFHTSIEQYNTQIQEKENELGALKEADSKNSKRIIELEKETERFRTSIEQYNTQIQEKENELGGLNESDNKNIKRIADLDKEISLKNFEIQNLITEKIEKERQLSAFQKADQQKQEQYEHKITELNALKNQLDSDRIRLQEEREEEIKIQFERMRETWRDHEKKVEEVIRGICSRRQIEYLDKEQIPFRGKPDNAIKIAGEYIIFDAKSPSSDDLENFPTYIKNQTEQLKKYVKEQGVNKSLFLVIPTNTIDVIEQFYYNLADYEVFIVTIDTLEPVIISLKKIENYNFAEQLSPEDRENICRVIGKFAHATKRRIQIDSYFCGEFINILNNCENLPEDVLELTQEFEKSDKMNPPMEKRAKALSPLQVKKFVRRIKQDADTQDIDVNVSGPVMETLPLYKVEKN